MTPASTQLCGGLTARDTLPPRCSLVESIRMRASEVPSSVAIQFGDDRLTYGELERRSNLLAHRLREQGAGRHTLTGLLMERSPAMVIGLLAIVKSGSAYVPLDPFYPASRIDGILRDAGIGFLLSETSVVTQLGLGHFSGQTVLFEDPEDLAQISEPREVDYDPEDTAYVIFTSGSTGKPKGVEISHQSLLNLLCSLQREPGLEAGDVMLAVTSIAFDIAAAELFLPLMTGAKIQLASQKEVAEPARLVERIERSGVTVMQATPVTWRMMMLAGWIGHTPLRVWCGGEEMTGKLAHDLTERSQEVWNLYGPTETTVWSSVKRVTHAEKTIPLGLPVANTSLYVLDEYGQDCEAGVAGELYIGGRGLAKSYWQRPDLTQAAFPTVRLATGETVRLYRSGDRARFRVDGQLEFLGRVDRQVKLRGYRIELAEIEYVARRCQGIDEVVVVKAEDSAEREMLVAYAVTQRGSVVSATELRMHLAEELPGYMIPASIRIVDHLPMTPNGKLDRRQLTNLLEPRRVMDSYDEPHDGTEACVAALWSKSLGLAAIGRNDNFFAIGGDSLLAAQVEAAMWKRFGERCVPGSLRRAPSVAAYAEVLAGNDLPTSVLLHKGSSATETIFWMDNPDRLPHLAGLLGERSFYSMLLRPEDIAEEAPQFPLEGLAARMVEHILGVQNAGRFAIGGFCQNALLAYEVARQLQILGLAVPLLIMIDPGDRFGLAKNGLSFSAISLRLEREWFHLKTMLRLAPPAWAGYLRRRYDGMRFELDGRRWKRVASRGSGESNEVPELAQALFASRISYVPQPYAGRVLFVEPTVRPHSRTTVRAAAWQALVARGRWVSVVGDHLGLFAPPAVERLARAIEQALDEHD